MHYGRIRKGFEFISSYAACLLEPKKVALVKSGICSQLLQFRFLCGIPRGTILKELIRSYTSSPPMINREVLPRAGCTLVRIKRFCSWLNLRPTCALRLKALMLGASRAETQTFAPYLRPWFFMLELVFFIFVELFHTVHLTSIDYPQIEGKFTATTGGLTNLFYDCKD